MDFLFRSSCLKITKRVFDGEWGRLADTQMGVLRFVPRIETTKLRLL